MKRILLIEDESSLSRVIELELRHEHFIVQTAFDGQAGLECALNDDWDLVLLDVMLPELNGIEICRRIRAEKTTPIIMLTAKSGIADRVLGLESGADDYMPKPFDARELVARIRALLRRTEMMDPCRSSRLTFRDIRADILARVVTKGSELVDLTKREFDLLVMFLRHPNVVLSREQLLDNVWGHHSPVETNVVDVYVRYLRNKLKDPGKKSCIETVRGIGYVLR
ncbi:response regulator transcription factor [Paenibacillus hamazuiensis]|uniref:response regulator transcription factor n=1 Tax=Paenibacillus hamazuiensis TaxID=2936508 RepID=UPI00200DC66D|nr:response regulator transcription factor [Paenibacillus hamazuiensis]